jgi:hypothetical protein
MADLNILEIQFVAVHIYYWEDIGKMNNSYRVSEL